MLIGETTEALQASKNTKKKIKYSYTKGRMLPCKRMSLHEHTHAISYIHTPAHAFISEHMVESHIFKKEGTSRLLL